MCVLGGCVRVRARMCVYMCDVVKQWRKERVSMLQRPLNCGFSIADLIGDYR